ncbi:MAG: winged helix-turn-helix transcriptional regulator [Candidatus Micrarchaeota archaeon]
MVQISGSVAMDKITIDRETLKALGADTRIAILKSLLERRKTQAELAGELNLSPPAVNEHLQRLEAAHLIHKNEEGKKWKYYSITEKGSAIVQQSNAPVWFLLSISALSLIIFSTQIYNKLFSNAPLTFSESGATMAQAGLPLADKAIIAAAPLPSGAAPVQATVSTFIPLIPLNEIAVVLISLLILGISIGMLVKRDSL